MARRFKAKKIDTPTEAKVMNPDHFRSIVALQVQSKLAKKRAGEEAQVRVKAAKKNGGLDGDALAIAVKLESLSPEKASRKAENIILALLDMGFLAGDLLSEGPAKHLKPWAEEVRKQFVRTDGEGRNVDIQASPVFDNTAVGKATARKETAAAVASSAAAVEDPELVAKRKAVTDGEIAEHDAREAKKAKTLSRKGAATYAMTN